MLFRKQLNHTHKVKKKKYPNGTRVYFCTLPGCFFKVEYDMMVGKIVLCNICEEPFQMTEASIKLDKPHCNNCGRIAVVNPETGRKTYVNKRQVPALGAVGESTVENLKERLASVVSYKTDDDI